MVESGWSCDFGMDGRRLWAHMLFPYDAEVATQAVIEMSKVPLPGGRFKPQVSDLREVLLSLTRRAEPQPALEEGKRGEAAPEWVHVWAWARVKRDPPVSEPFPQQQDYVDPTAMLSKADFEKLRAEWVKAGSPKSADSFHRFLS